MRTISGGTGLTTAISDKNLTASAIDELIPSASMRPTRISSVGTQVPTAIYSAAHSALVKRNAMASAGRNKSEQFTSISGHPTDHFTIDSPPPAPLETGEYLRDEFASSAANWMDFIAANITPNSNTPNNSFSSNQDVLKRYTFALECDRTMRKVMQVVYDRLCLGLLGERCACLCRSSSGYRRLELLWNAASLSENVEKDYGRVLLNDESAIESEIDIALLGKLGKDLTEFIFC